MQWRWFQKTQWTNTSRWHCTQIITDCGNLTLDFKQLVLRASPPFLQTLGPWFTNEIQIKPGLSVGCASFSFHSTFCYMLGYSTLWTASLVMNVCVFSSLWRVSMIVFWTTVRSAVFPMIVSPSEPNWDHFEGSGNRCRCFELIRWLACHHIIISWEWIGGFL